MYEDDRFNPAYNDDINELDELDKQKTANKLEKNADLNFAHCRKELKKEITKKNGETVVVKKSVYYDLYGSLGFGHKIRHAITGFKTNHLVGSSDEDLYFVVSDARGLTGTQTQLTLYFDSPEQYEKHCYVTVPNTIKNSWSEKNRKALKVLNNE